MNVRVTVQLEPAITGATIEQVAAVNAKSVAFMPVTLGLLLRVSVALPVFISVAVIAVLVDPVGTGPNGTLAGRLAIGAGTEVPVPVSGTLWVAGVALSAKLSDADSAAKVEGLNVIVTVQLPPAATWFTVEQVMELIAKSAAFAPVTVGLLEKMSGPVPVFISVIGNGALVAPWGTEPNGPLAGSVTAGAVPIPVSATV